jgi:DNA-binding IclR family transcriptional regulator
MSKDAGAGEPDAVLGTTDRSLAILEYLQQVDGATLSEIATEFDSPPSTVHGHLTTLHDRQFVVRDGDTYYPGPKLLKLGQYARTRRPGYEIARKYVERLYEETGFRTVFVAEQGGRAVFLFIESGDQSGWQHEQVGNQLSLHNTAVGKAILAEMSEDRIDAVIDRWGLPAETDATIDTVDELHAELAATRERGYAINRSENMDGLYAIGAAVTDASGDVVGAFSLSGPKMVLPTENPDADTATALRQAVEECELELTLG